MISRCPYCQGDKFEMFVIDDGRYYIRCMERQCMARTKFCPDRMSALHELEIGALGFCA